ncbi:cytochrome ubiquinol oxidase subunit I [Ramlibacter sp.]|uniref:cytochrome ubiquinol oxidase subunit I n=1 Tax=Ramlibacter sp. TaxID=1917967 RepID=UPI002613569B|nr:cytochrome ubiquinol oxidase subunit I [Ramlibacter sp.]MDB5956413.1 cytochrome bd ubiquinol oxidase subunit [Ramlibacter sp.]
MTPEFLALLLSRVQFAFTVSFHIIFPTFTVGLAAWLCLLEFLYLRTARRVYRRLFDFWLRIFAVAFGLGVVTGVVLGFEFGTNWSELSRRTGPIQGPLLAYESFTAFALEAAFFGVLLFGRKRVPRWFYLVACAMVMLGTSLSAFWIMVNNSWMQAPIGSHMGGDGIFVPDSWVDILFSPVVWVRFPHMLLASYVTSAFFVAAMGAWYLLGGRQRAQARVMLHMGLGLAAVLVPVQLLFGHLCGEYVDKYQPAKMAAIEARWDNEQPASEVLLAWPDVENRRNLYALTLPAPLGSLIDSDDPAAAETGLNSIPRADWPPVLIPFFTFRIMVGLGILMLALAWRGTWLALRGRLEAQRGLLWATFLCFPIGWVATLAGWFTAEVGRQPWVVYGAMRTADAVTPFLTPQDVTLTLLMFGGIYVLIFAGGAAYIYAMLRRGPLPAPAPVGLHNPRRPLALLEGEGS